MRILFALLLLMQCCLFSINAYCQTTFHKSYVDCADQVTIGDNALIQAGNGDYLFPFGMWRFSSDDTLSYGLMRTDSIGTPIWTWNYYYSVSGILKRATFD